MEEVAARQFAPAWISAWNSHDLDGILAHYSEDIAFSSPFAIKLMGVPNGVVRGKFALRAYFSKALMIYPELCFNLVEVFAGARSVAIHYRSVKELLACETMVFNAADQVCQVFAHYAESSHGTTESSLDGIQRADRK